MIELVAGLIVALGLASLSAVALLAAIAVTHTRRRR